MSEPQLLDFACPRCRADVGEPCRSPLAGKVERGHLGRQDRHARAVKAHRARLVEARWAAEDAAAS